jgi:hypothetical protein
VDQGGDHPSALTNFGFTSFVYNSKTTFAVVRGEKLRESNNNIYL